MMKPNAIKKRKKPQRKSEGEILEREIEDLIDREKTKNRIVEKLLNNPATSGHSLQ